MSSGFVSTDDGYVNAAHIVRIEEINRGGRVEYICGDQVARVNLAMTMDSALIQLSPVVSAQPGWSIVDVSRNPPHEVTLTAIVAWRIDGQLAVPVCVDWFFGAADGDYAVASPDGTITVPGTAVFLSIKDYRDQVIEDRARRPETAL